MKNSSPKFKIIEDKTTWQKLLNKTLFKTFFHTLEWESFLEENFKWLKFQRYLYKKEALLSFAKYKIFKEERLISHPFCEYGGPLPLKNGIDGPSFKKDLFLDFKESFKISFHPEIPKYFKNLGLKEPDSERNTYLIENLKTKTEKDILNHCRKTTRNEIKKSQLSPILLEQCRNKGDLKDFYTLYLKNAKKHKTLPYPFSFFLYFLGDNMKGKAEIILAKFKNKVVAGSVFLFYDEFIHYFLNASNEKYKNFRANYLILWHQLRDKIGKNYCYFDFGGTRHGSQLEIFKRGWATQRYPIFEITNQLEENGPRRARLRNLFGVLPPFLIKKLSPYLLKYKL